MKKLLVVLLVTVAFCSCKSYEPTKLYAWTYFDRNENLGFRTNYSEYNQRFFNYSGSLYQCYKTQTPETYGNLYRACSMLLEHPGGKRGVPPPGLCAEYGYLLILPETPAYLVEYYNNPENFTAEDQEKMAGTDWSMVFTVEALKAKALELFQKEMDLYPESAPFMEIIIKNLNKQ